MNSNEHVEALSCPTLSHCIVSAGPGSGKTHFVARRVENVIRESEQYFVHCISFTNEASNEMKRRLNLSSTEKRRCACSTIHKFCLDQLSLCISRSTDSPLKKLKPIKSEKLLCVYLRKAMGTLSISIINDEVNNLLNGSGRANIDFDDQDIEVDVPSEDDLESGFCKNVDIPKETMVHLQRLLSISRSRVRGLLVLSKEQPKLLTVLTKYEKLLAAENMIDFELIIPTWISHFSEVVFQSITPLTHLFVDEFQDLDQDQLVVLHLLVKQRGVVLTVVGDGNQSIYGWRRQDGNMGAKKVCRRRKEDSNFQVLEQLLSGFPLCQYSLRTNHRSAKAIVLASNNMIGEKLASCFGPNTGRGLACAIACTSESDEFEKAVHVVSNLIGMRGGGANSSIAVLVRFNSDKERLVNRLRELDIPVVVTSKHFSRDPVAKQSSVDVPSSKGRSRSLTALLWVLRAAEFPKDKKGFLGSVLARGKKFCANTHPIMKWMGGILDNHMLTGDITSLGDPLVVEDCGNEETDYVDQFANQIRQIEVSTEKNSLGLRNSVKQQHGLLKKVAGSLGVVGKVASAMDLFGIKKTIDVEKLLSLAPKCQSVKDLFGLLQGSLCNEVAESPDRSSSRASVYVGTIHSAKGREWHTVVLPFVNEGHRPGACTDWNEERRVLYVGVTRAIQNVILTCTAGHAGLLPCRFLTDMKIPLVADCTVVMQMVAAANEAKMVA